MFGRKSINMQDAVKSVETKGKDTWYLTEIGGKSASDWKTEFDMKKSADKADALRACTPFSTVIYKIGSLFSNGKAYLVDAEGNDVKDKKILALMDKPNPLQTFRSFLSQAEMCMRTYGYCPIYTNRLSETSIPVSMWIIQPSLFHITGTGKVFNQVDISEIIEDAYIEFGVGRIDLERGDYFIIYDGDIVLPSNKGDEIRFGSSVDALSVPVSNWMASMVASNTLIVNGGPKGIIYNNDNSESANAQLTSVEQQSLLDKFKAKYGLMKKQYSILVTKAKLGWIALNYDSSKLKLHEEDERCTNKIANAIGINPSLFNESKYENQEAAKRSAYQDLIIPNAEIIADSLTRNLCPEGVFMKIDFSHVECLQTDKGKEAEVVSKVIDALIKAKGGNLLTQDESREMLANYIDIDPNKPKGEYGSEE